MKKFNNKDGETSIFGVLFLGVIIVLVLSYFHISIKTIVESPDTKNNFSYVIVNGKNIWDGYLKKPALYLWDFFVSGIAKISDNKLIDIDTDVLIPSKN